MPTKHSAQLGSPVEGWCLPGEHSKQDVELADGWALPLAHSVQVLWPTSEVKVPAVQGKHIETPVPENFPALHSKQVVALADEYLPVEQTVQLLAPLPLIMPGSQALQSSMLSWNVAKLPLSLKNVPPGQLMQLLAPVFGM